MIEPDLGHRSPVRSRLLVMLGDETVEQPDPEGRRALRHSGGILFRPGDTGNVEMRPGHVVDKALDELRPDRAAGAAIAADILDVRRVAVDRAVVAVGERHPPQLFADRLAGSD